MNPNKSPTELRAALAALRPYFVRAGWFSLLGSLLVLAPSGYMLEVYGRVVNSRSHMTLWMLTLLILGVYVLMELLEWARSEVMRAASVEWDERMRGRIFHAIFDANLKRVPGGTQQPLNDFKLVREFLYSPVLLGLMESPVSLVMLVLLFLISPVLGWTSIAFACVITLVGWFNERSTKPPLMQANRSAIAAQQYADGSLRNAQVIESMGMLRDIHARWMDKQREFLNLQAKASESAGGYQAVSKFLQTTLSSGLLGLGCWLLLHNSLNGGDVMMIMASVFGGRVVAPLVQAVSQWQTVINVRDAWSRLDSLLGMVPQRGAGHVAARAARVAAGGAAGGGRTGQSGEHPQGSGVCPQPRRGAGRGGAFGLGQDNAGTPAHRPVARHHGQGAARWCGCVHLGQVGAGPACGLSAARG